MRRTIAPGIVAVAAGLWAWWTGRRSCTSHPGGDFAEQARDADYVDCYCASIGPGVTIDMVDGAAIQRGREIERTPSRIVYEDAAPGLLFVVAYELQASAGRLLFATAVRYNNETGRRYFAVVRPVHRLLAPAIPIITSRRSQNELHQRGR